MSMARTHYMLTARRLCFSISSLQKITERRYTPVRHDFIYYARDTFIPTRPQGPMPLSDGPSMAPLIRSGHFYFVSASQLHAPISPLACSYFGAMLMPRPTA